MSLNKNLQALIANKYIHTFGHGFRSQYSMRCVPVHLKIRSFRTVRDPVNSKSQKNLTTSNFSLLSLVNRYPDVFFGYVDIYFCVSCIIMKATSYFFAALHWVPHCSCVLIVASFVISSCSLGYVGFRQTLFNV